MEADTVDAKAKAKASATHKPQRIRSPEAPFIPLGRAIDRARQFLKEEPRNAAPINVAARHWGYGEKSSGGLQTIAALKHFGLMIDEGAGEMRKVKVTDLARRILLDEQTESPERDRAIRQAALRPKLYAEVWEKWGSTLPSDETFRTYLVLERNFNRKSADDFIRCYKDTIAFAKLSDPDSVSPGSQDTETGEGATMLDATPPHDRSASAKAGLRVFSWPLSKEVSAEVRLTGPDIRPDHLERLRQYLDLAKDALGSDSD